jgi:hypothetical protein
MRTVMPTFFLALACASMAAWWFWPRSEWEPHQETVTTTNPDGSHTYTVTTTLGELAGPGHRYIRFDHNWCLFGTMARNSKEGYGYDTPRDQVPDDLKPIWDSYFAKKGG